MNDGTTGSSYPGYFRPSRREVLKWIAYGSAGVALAGTAAGCTSDAHGASPSSSTTQPAKKARGRQRTLVVVELGGGNDALSTLVPYTSATYRKARPTLAMGEDEVIDWGDGLGLNKRLHGLNDKGLAIVEGIGTATPNLSHFEMLDRWAAGSAGVLSASEQAAGHPGFLGRLCDEIQGDERFTGFSIKFGNAATLRTAKSATTSLPPTAESFLTADATNGTALDRYLHDLGSAPHHGPLGPARQGFGRVLWILDLLNELPEPSTGYPDTDFGTQLAITSRLLRSDHGVRIVHVPMGSSSYDTHADHRHLHGDLMTQLNDGLTAFVDDLRKHDLQDDVLIATTSEFGRRFEEHSEGLDHGAASLAMMMGPVKTGIHGDPSPIEQLDEDGNLIATLSFDRYLATLATWLGVEPEAVLKRDDKGKVPTAIEGLLTA